MAKWQNVRLRSKRFLAVLLVILAYLNQLSFPMYYFIVLANEIWLCAHILAANASMPQRRHCVLVLASWGFHQRWTVWIQRFLPSQVVHLFAMQTQVVMFTTSRDSEPCYICDKYFYFLAHRANQLSYELGHSVFKINIAFKIFAEVKMTWWMDIWDLTTRLAQENQQLLLKCSDENVRCKNTSAYAL
jgi:hypothetical protein